jgi:hypothetical protein
MAQIESLTAKSLWNQRANILMDNGERITVTVCRDRLKVAAGAKGKRAVTLYDIQDERHNLKLGLILHCLYKKPIVPQWIENPILSAVTNAVFHCKDSEQLELSLAHAVPWLRLQAFKERADEVEAPTYFFWGQLA